jgi:hypothetical protein
MPDISMCLDHECPLRMECYRYRAHPTPMAQAYDDFKYDGGCDAHWPIEGRRVRTEDEMKEQKP